MSARTDTVLYALRPGGTVSLPLVEEIRTARAAFAEAQAATLDLAHIEAAIGTLDVIERQLALHPERVAEVPADALVAALAEGWTALSDLAFAGPRGGGGSAHAFAARRSQLELARQHLRPIARKVGTAAVELHELQHRQLALLETPEYAREHEELHALTAERDRVSRELLPLQQQLGVVRPTLRTMEGFLGQVDGEIARRAGDAGGLGAWRTAYLLVTLVRSLDDLLAEVGLRPAMPVPPDLPPAPDGEGADRLWDAVVATRDGLRALHTALAEQVERVRVASVGLEAERDRLEAVLLERMG